MDTGDGVWDKWEKQHLKGFIKDYFKHNVGKTRGYLIECDRSCIQNKTLGTLASSKDKGP